MTNRRMLKIFCPWCDKTRQTPMPDGDGCKEPIETPIKISCNRCMVKRFPQVPLSVLEAIERQGAA